jgi:hypothetical protein
VAMSWASGLFGSSGDNVGTARRRASLGARAGSCLPLRVPAETL